MNYPRVESHSEVAEDMVTAVLNAAETQIRFVRCPTSPGDLPAAKSSVRKPHPFAISTTDVVRSSEALIEHTIEHVWKIHSFKHFLRFLESGRDECAQYYYFEVVFSQPTNRYPVPQTTASAFFTTTVSLIHGSSQTPKMTFRLEAHHSVHDVHAVLLPEDWLLGLMKAKRLLYSTVEELNLF